MVELFAVVEMLHKRQVVTQARVILGDVVKWTRRNVVALEMSMIEAP